MESLSFRFKNETPLFMHGAENTAEAELRASSVKGVVRYWFRALVGGGLDGRGLSRVERQFFGGRGNISPFRLRVVSHRPRVAQSFLLPHKTGIRARSSACITPGLNFGMTLEFRSSELKRDLLGWSLWTAAMLGGFGQRARRGCGSLRLVSMDPVAEGWPSVVALETVESYRRGLQDGLARASALSAEVCGPVQFEGTPPFPVLKCSAGQARIVTVPIADAKNEAEARIWLMAKLRPFKDPAFGLPLRMQDKTLPGRLASPLWCKLSLLENRWVCTMTLLHVPAFESGLPPAVAEWYQAMLGMPECTEVSF